VSNYVCLKCLLYTSAYSPAYSPANKGNKSDNYSLVQLYAMIRAYGWDAGWEECTILY
jgi:hypothetical protein